MHQQGPNPNPLYSASKKEPTDPPVDPGAMIRERPILFSGPMVRAILDGRKTQTRRIVKSQPYEEFGPDGEPNGISWNGSGMSAKGRGWFRCGIPHWMLDYCPYGQAGDLLWVRETWAVPPQFNAIKPSDLMPADIGRGFYVRGEDPQHTHAPVLYGASYTKDGRNGLRPAWEGSRWRPSIHMPKWACRIWLRVKDVRVERLRDITPRGAFAEGKRCSCMKPEACPGSAELIPALSDSWDSIYANRGLGWDANPWVWVVEFEPHDRGQGLT